MLGDQAPDAVMMVRPNGFGYNPETAATNAFQQTQGKHHQEQIIAQALSEFDGLVLTLKTSGVDVVEFNPQNGTETPDAVFPNNWVSFHHDGRVILYPMMTPSRRLERHPEYVRALENHNGFEIKEVIDLSHFENQQLYLEGTGSLVMDYINGVIYSNHSPRSSGKLVKKVAEILGYSVCRFYAVDATGKDIYHTNVMMCVGDYFAVVCLDAVRIPEERARLEASLTAHGHEIIAISESQMRSFAGNMMQLSGNKGQSILVMSESAYQSLDQQQVQKLSSYAALVYSPIDTIEKYGGGSVRCMLAGIFLRKISNSPPSSIRS